MESRKMVLMNLCTGQRWRRRHREKNCGRSRGRRWLDELRGEHGKIYSTMCKTDKTSGNLLCDSGCSTQGPVTTPRGGMGWEVGGDTCIPTADSCWWMAETTPHCKAALLQWKIRSHSHTKAKPWQAEQMELFRIIRSPWYSQSSAFFEGFENHQLLLLDVLLTW